MKPPVKIWRQSEVTPLKHELIKPMMGRILAARGLDLGNALDFISNRTIVHDPFLLNDMDKGMKVLWEAHKKKWPVCVYLDCDADGLAAGAVLIRGLRALGFTVLIQIADRLNGFGMKGEALQDMYKRGARVVITADTGTSATDAWKMAPKKLRRIVTDHHLPDHDQSGKPVLPNVDALINPKVPGNRYPLIDVCGAGMALKFIQATQLSGFPTLDPVVMEKLEALATIGTVADMMPIVDENKSLVRRGIEALSRNVLPGVAALREATKWKDSILLPPVEKTKDISYGFSGILNAAGRHDKALEALSLLVTDDHVEAKLFAEQLKQTNKQRGEVRDDVYTAAKVQVDAAPDALAAITAKVPASVHGPIGGPASRFAREYRRNAFLVKEFPDEVSGSARAFDHVDGDVITPLEKAKNAGIIFKAAGHKQAVAFSMRSEKYDEFVKFIQAEEAKKFPNGIPPNYITYDFVLYPHELTPDLWRAVAPLAPFGMANPEPVLAVKDVKVLRVFPDKEDPSKTSVMIRTDGDKHINAKFRGQPDLKNQIRAGDVIDLVFSVDQNSYSRKVELLVVDWRHSLRKHTPGRQLDPVDL